MARSIERFVGPTRLTNSAATVYTVPGLSSALVRHIHFMNPSASAVSVTVSIGADGATTRVLETIAVPAAGTYDWYPYMVLYNSEIVQAYASTTATVNMTMFGDLLSVG
jgi:hypothetical protein